MGLPIPEELPIVSAGAIVGHNSSGGHPYWWIMLPTCIVGVVVGDGFLYAIGRLWGYRVLNIGWVRKRLLTPDKQERIERNFHRYGFWILLGARLLPGIRSPIFLMAGINRLPLIKFLIADIVYAIPGVSMLFFLAYEFTDEFVALIKKAEGYRATIILCLIAAAVGYLTRYFQEHPVSTGDPSDLPLFGQQLMSHMKEPKEDEQSEEDSQRETTDLNTRPKKPDGAPETGHSPNPIEPQTSAAAGGEISSNGSADANHSQMSSEDEESSDEDSQKETTDLSARPKKPGDPIQNNNPPSPRDPDRASPAGDDPSSNGSSDSAPHRPPNSSANGARDANHPPKSTDPPAAGGH
jgi:membrane protein DedA with SNARE-associated domain